MNKKIIISVVLTAIICLTIGVYAGATYDASQIVYKNTTLDLAMDDLYEKANIETFTPSGQITPSKNAQTLQTQNKKVTSDITIKPIQPINFLIRIGSQNVTMSQNQTRVPLRTNFSSLYKYFKVTAASNDTAQCTSIYLNSTYDQSSGNMSLNTQYSINDYENFTIYTSGAAHCFYYVILYLYN